jgi:hypothetical protein
MMKEPGLPLLPRGLAKNTPFEYKCIKFLCTSAALLFLAALFGSCPLLLGEDFIMSSSRFPIADYDLSHYIPIPADGAQPVRNVSKPGMSIKAEWSHHLEEEKTKPVGAFFVAGTIYQAVITIEIVDTRHYCFDEDSRFIYPGLDMENQVLEDMGDYKRKITVTYKPAGDADRKLPVSDYELSHYIPIPVDGALPVRSTSGPGMSIKAEWSPDPGTTGMTDRVFVAGTIYEAEITVTIVDTQNYYFDEASPFRYSELAEGSHEDGDTPDPDVRKITVTYLPAKDVGIKQAVLAEDLSYYIPIPWDGQNR